jgi:dihydroorotase/N-acyl-D-amino-acid deacylase
MLKLRTGLRASIGALLAAAALSGVARAQTAPAAPAKYDVLIVGGHVVDGTGNPWYSADVGIKDGVIADIGKLAGATATQTIDAKGMVVTPGYIDLHTHSDMALLADGNAESKIRQGVTLDVLGESSTVAPRDDLPVTTDDGVTTDWTTFTGYFDRLKKQGTSMNVVSHASFEQIRRIAVGYSPKPATPAQLERMKMLMARSMAEGAWGMVLRFESGGPAFPEEVIALAKIVSAHGGNVTSHMGSEGFAQDKELDFMFRLAREAKVPIHIFHFKIRGQQNWPKMQHYIDRVASARAEGITVTVDEYPYTAMNHGWSAFFPVWARVHGPAEFAKMLKDPAVVARIKADPDFKSWMHEHGDAPGITYARSSFEGHKQYLGMRLAEIAKLRGDADPVDTCIQLMAEAGGNIGGIFHAMSEENVQLVMRQPWVAIASDAGALNLNAAGFPHPRTYGTAVRVLGRYVRDEKVLTLEDAVRKMTSFPAQILGLTGRGQIAKGFHADVVVFDPATVAETGTYQKPKSYPIGVNYVVVNGVVVIDKGQHTGARPGMVLYGKGTVAPPAQ